MMVTTISVISAVCAALLVSAQGKPLRGSGEHAEPEEEHALTTARHDGSYSGVIVQATEDGLRTTGAHPTVNRSDIVEKCETYARIVVNGKNRIEEVITTFGDQDSIDDEEEERRKISEAVARILNGRSGDKLDKYFRCVERLSGGS